jgi:predicted dehydrogenase
MFTIMQANRSFRVGLVGYGLAGSCFHAPFIAITEGLELAAIVTRDARRQQQATRTHPRARIVEDVEQLWTSASELDVVVVASPNRTHVPLARRAVDAGVAVVVDKPLAPSAAEARELIDRARRGRVLLTVFQNRRWDGDFQTLRRLLADGAVGRPLRFESRFERWRPTPKAGWRQRPDREDAGGLLFDLGSHLIDQALLLFGPVDHVYAELDRSMSGAEVDDDSFVALTHVSGVRSHLFMSTAAAQSGPRFRVLGTTAAFVKWGLDGQEDELRAGATPDRAAWGEEPAERWGRLGAGGIDRAVPTIRGAYQEFYRGLVMALRGEGPLPVDPADAARVLDLIEAAHVSSAQRRVVAVQPSTSS